jgi:hypothetical protein
MECMQILASNHEKMLHASVRFHVAFGVCPRKKTCQIRHRHMTSSRPTDRSLVGKQKVTQQGGGGGGIEIHIFLCGASQSQETGSRFLTNRNTICSWGKKKLLPQAISQSGMATGNSPSGFSSPNPSPRQKKFPAGIPTNACGGHFFPIPVPRGDKSPSGIPIPA